MLIVVIGEEANGWLSYESKSLQFIALKLSVVKLLQPLNALLLIEVTLLPIVTEVKLLQSLNALLPIEVTLLGIVTEVKLLL